jgi:hypothetical protein
VSVKVSFQCVNECCPLAEIVILFGKVCFDLF